MAAEPGDLCARGSLHLVAVPRHGRHQCGQNIQVCTEWCRFQCLFKCKFLEILKTFLSETVWIPGACTGPLRSYVEAPLRQHFFKNSTWKRWQKEPDVETIKTSYLSNKFVRLSILLLAYPLPYFKMCWVKKWILKNQIRNQHRFSTVIYFITNNTFLIVVFVICVERKM